MTRVLSGVAAFGVLVLLVAGCGGSKKSSSGGESKGKKATIAGVSANDHGTKQVSGKAEVELDNYYFNPTVLKGKPGARVTLDLKNEGSVEHNFSIDSQSIDQNIQPGKTATVTVQIPSSGQVSFYCKFHKSMGMAGALEASGTSAGGGSTTTTETTTTSSTSPTGY
jgi:plastocyanin